MRHVRPLIGITMRHELETERFYLARAYGDAVEAAGGVPVHISLIPHAGYIETLLSTLSGVLLPGSASDVDPLRYGREPRPPPPDATQSPGLCRATRPSPAPPARATASCPSKS